MILIHPSSLGTIMTEPKAKGEVLSVGAKTYLNMLAKQHFFDFNAVITSKYLEKGIRCEQDSIDLYNSVFFTDYKKNTERRSSDILTGECDIYTGPKMRKTIDIKSAWCLATFPATADEAHDKDYEWQGRAYMMLWDCDVHEVAYCMVDTPDDLVGYEQQDLHFVGHIPLEHRVTIIRYERDAELEEKIKINCRAAQEYVQARIIQIGKEHQY